MLYSRSGFRQKPNASGETSGNPRKPKVRIFFQSTFDPSEQVGQTISSMLGRHNNLQDRYKNRATILHFEEHRQQLKVPIKIPRRQKRYNSPATRSHPTIPESNNETNNVSSNHRGKFNILIKITICN